MEALIVGAGPVGLTLAGELARHGQRCRIIDRLEQPSPYCRAIGVTPRTLEIFEGMGVVREMIDAGLWIEGWRAIINGTPPQDIRTDFSDLPYAPLGVPQYATERILARHLAGLGGAVERGVALAALEQDESRVRVQLHRSDGTTETEDFAYVIGCDGAHSAVRRAAGIAFEGDAFPMKFMLGDVHIDWDLPRGIALRAMRLHEGGPPDLLIAVPLPERGRYRISTLAAPEFAASGSTEHGLQSEAPGPSLAHLQPIADDLVPGKPRLSDLRWSSIFRISMRLADRYRRGRVFIAGDAAHIHPPTGGQGMNTGIQDAYNLAWKLALVLGGAAPPSLLDSYEAERLPVGRDVVARTRAATERFGRDPAAKPDRLADTQIRLTYRGSASVREDAGDLDPAAPAAGDRAPDATGLRRHGVGFPVRLFEVLRGTGHVLVAPIRGAEGLHDLAALGDELRVWPGPHLRIVGIAAEALPEQPGIALFQDREGAFAKAYGTAASYLVRPDGYIGWRGRSWREAGLLAYLREVLLPLEPAPTARSPKG